MAGDLREDTIAGRVVAVGICLGVGIYCERIDFKLPRDTEESQHLLLESTLLGLPAISD